MSKGPAPKFDKAVGKPDPYPAGKANNTGSKGGFPGVSPNNGGRTQAVGNLHKGAQGSGHIAAHTNRACNTGFCKGGKGK